MKLQRLIKQTSKQRHDRVARSYARCPEQRVTTILTTSNDNIDDLITSRLDCCYECIRTGRLIRAYYKVRSVLLIDYEMMIDEGTQAHRVTTLVIMGECKKKIRGTI